MRDSRSQHTGYGKVQTIPPQIKLQGIRRLSHHFEGGELLNHAEHDHNHLVEFDKSMLFDTVSVNIKISLDNED